MSEQDEYDSYFAPLTLNDEDLDVIQAAEARALSPGHPMEHTQEPCSHNAPLSCSSPSPDEWNAYDLRQFSPEDFEQIDKLPTGGDGDVKHGGPSIEIALEPDRNAACHRMKGSCIRPQKCTPYEQFRSDYQVLSVTDITAPSWCEVQFDYGLRQQRNKKLEDQPPSFVTAEGKTINVARQVAAVNARTLARGTSVHKALEGRIRREAVTKIEIKTNEERWGRRLVNMLTSLYTMMGLGRCREMPVFGLINDQIVIGIIDEVVRQPLPASPTFTSPSTKGPSSKKICPEPSDGQRRIRSFISPTSRGAETAEAAINIELEEPATPAPSQLELPEVGTSSVPDTLRYSLHLSDTKTRTHSTLPPEKDAFAGRIQLMLYHRLLSNALSAAQPDIASFQPLDFDAFWRKAGVDSTRGFSDSFLLHAGLSNAQRAPREGESLENPATDLSSIHCLNDLTRAWHRKVKALNAVRVDNTLTIVYRAQPTRACKSAAPASTNVKGKEKERDNETGGMSASEFTAASTPSLLSEGEVRDIAPATQASLSDIQRGTGGDRSLARAIRDTPARAHVDADALVLAEDTQLEWALQESLLEQFKDVLALNEAVSETVVSSGIGAPAVDVVEEASEEDKAESGVSVGTLLSRAATEEAEGAFKTAPSSPPAGQLEWDEDEDEDEAEGAFKTAPSSPLAGQLEWDEDEDEDDTMITAAELETKAKIIGTKEFALDDGLLDDYLKSVLAWWYGKRPPQGVDVHLTGRCFTCEYMDGCEWREKKASEALQKYRDRSMSGATADWM